MFSLAFGPVVFAPLGLYLVVVFLQTLASMISKGFVRSLLAAPLLVVSHILYGLGFWRGLFTPLKKPGDKPATEVVLDSMPV